MDRTACTVTIIGERGRGELGSKFSIDLVSDAIAERYPDATPTVRHLRLDQHAVAVTVLGLDALTVAGVLDGFAHRHDADRFEGINGWGPVVGIAGYLVGESFVGHEAPDHVREVPETFVR